MPKIRRQRGGNETIYQVTMPLFFRKTYDRLEDVEHEDDENAVEFCRKVQLFREMDERFPTKASIEAHVKTQEPNAFVEYLANGEEFDAHWNPDSFAITFKVKSDENLEDFKRSFDFTSLADGQWESSDDNGWTVKTGLMDHSRYGRFRYEYGLTNFKPENLEIEVVPPAAPAPVAAPVPVPVSVPPVVARVLNNASNNESNNSSNNRSSVSSPTTQYIYSNNNAANQGGKRKTRKRKTRKSKRKNRS